MVGICTAFQNTRETSADNPGVSAEEDNTEAATAKNG